MKLRTTLVGVAAAAIALVSPLAASAGTATLHAKLDGASVVPGPGDDDARGKFKAKIKSGELCAKLKLKKAGEVTGVSISSGVAGETGTLHIALDLESSCSTIVPDEEDTEATLSESEAAAITADPGSFYVQVSTDEHPAGAVRGQLK